MNNTFNTSDSINMDAIKNEIRKQTPVQPVAEETEVIGSFLDNNSAVDNDVKDIADTSNEAEDEPTSYIEVTEPDETIFTNEDTTVVIPEVSDDTKESSYEGPGIVIDKPDENEQSPQPNHYTGITPDTEDYATKYLAEMDAAIASIKEKEEVEESVTPDETLNDVPDEMSYEPSDTENANTGNINSLTKDEFNDKYNEAVVVIDKTNMGTVINFSESEREKLERVRKIKIEEVETVDLETIKIKSVNKKKDNLGNIIKKITVQRKSNIVLPASGYTAVMNGCSAHELVNLITTDDNNLLATQTKCSLIYDKIESTSIGHMEYTDWLLHTSALDLDMFIYGIICATFDESDTIEMTCPKCKTVFTHPYTMKQLLRAEAMDEKLLDVVSDIVDSSVSEEMAKECHMNALVNTHTRIKLPESGIVADICTSSLYTLINKILTDLDKDKLDHKYDNVALYAAVLDSLYVPDPEDGEYYQIDGTHDMIKVAYSLSEKDNNILTKFMDDVMSGWTFEFGFMNIDCPNCKHHTNTVNVDISEMLFHKYQQSMTTTVE